MNARILSLALAIPLACAASAAWAEQTAQTQMPPGFSTKAVLEASKTTTGQPIQYPSGTAKITAVELNLAPGASTPRHQHPVPTYVYVLDGILTIQADGGETRTYKAGENFVEAVNTWHVASSAGDAAAKALVVFAGAEGQKNFVMSEEQATR